MTRSRASRSWGDWVAASTGPAILGSGVGLALLSSDDITSKPKLRQALFIARRWLATNPRTGLDHLPHDRTAGGAALYRLSGVLTDADLFRRLRLRATTTGGAPGLHD